MNILELTNFLVESGASEREIESASIAISQKSGEERSLFIESMKQRYSSNTNKANPPTVKATSSAAKAAQEAGISLSDVPSTDGKVTVEDVKKAVESK